jgi:hypothetical protein
VPACTLGLFHRFAGLPLTTPHVLLAFTSFPLALGASVAAYRLSPWHPLASFPGPRLLRVSKLAYVRRLARGDSHVYIRRLHDEYGPFVRIAPNEISVRHVDAVSQVLGANGLPKGQCECSITHLTIPIRSLSAYNLPNSLSLFLFDFFFPVDCFFLNRRGF